MVSPLKAILLNSGGIDSRVAAAIAHKSQWNLVSLYIDCNPYSRSRSLPAAERTAELYCSEHVVMPFPMDLILLGDKRPNPSLPGGTAYSSLFCAILASSYAKWRGDVNCIVSGTKNDAWVPEWKDRLAELMAGYKLHKPPMFFAPVAEMLQVKDVYLKAQELGVPLEDTSSCGAAEPCGICKKCVQRGEMGLPIL